MNRIGKKENQKGSPEAELETSNSRSNFRDSPNLQV